MDVPAHLLNTAAILMGPALPQMQGSPSSSKDPAARNSIDILEMRLDRQNLLIQTLLMLLLEKKIIQETEFREWLKYVDGLDGRVDGRLRPNNSPLICEACGRNNGPASIRCQYCGHEFKVQFTDGRAERGKDNE